MLYEDVAQRLERLIHDGTLLPGHRLPSVRHVRDRWGVSVATAQHAFRVLETRGLVEARRARATSCADTPRLWLPAPEPSVPLPGGRAPAWPLRAARDRRARTWWPSALPCPTRCTCR
jgi:DNA-binding transcriptional MocR family regulator